MQASDIDSLVRVMSYNIHHGAGMDGQVDIERIARLISDTTPHVVCLQEVDCDVPRSGNVDTIALLAHLTGMQGMFGKNLNYQGGGYGNGILTILNVIRHSNHHYRMIRPNEQRGVVHARLALDDIELAVLNTHVDYRPDPTERLMNIGEIRQIAESYAPCPVVVCGDFNSLPDGVTIQAMQESFSDAWSLAGKDEGFTFPSDQPNRRIDYIFLAQGASTPNCQVERAFTLPSIASDHLPLVVDLRFRQT